METSQLPGNSKGDWVVRNDSGAVLDFFPTQEAAEKWLSSVPRDRVRNPGVEPAPTTAIHVLRMTPRMREKILSEGLPLFQSGVPVPPGPVPKQDEGREWRNPQSSVPIQYGRNYF